MNIFNILILLNIFNLASFQMTNNYNKFRNLNLRFLVFGDKKIIKALRYVKKTSNQYYNKSIASIEEGVINYNYLSEDDQTIIELVLSLCY